MVYGQNATVKMPPDEMQCHTENWSPDKMPLARAIV